MTIAMNGSSASSSSSSLSPQEVRKAVQARADELFPQLTLDEKIGLLSGRDMARTKGVPRLNLPLLKTSDGPNGIRGSEAGLDSFIGFPFAPGQAPLGSAMWPNASAQAATWSCQDVEAAGRGIGKEGWAKNTHVALAPTINLHRDPRNGRCFEAFSEDPYLTGQVASAWTSGCQDDAGVLVTLKHFVGNECETQRHSSNVLVDDATLREVYMRPFELAMLDLKKRGKLPPAAIMTAYNSLAGEPCSSNQFLNTQVLREEWKYEGLIMSDWFGTYKAKESFSAGLDLEMPVPAQRRPDVVKKLLSSGEITQEQIDGPARHVLEAILLAQTINKGSKFFCDAELSEDKEQPAPQDAARDEEIRNMGSSACVLLKNINNLLPIDASKIKSIAIIGEPAQTPLVSGGGSANMPGIHTVSPLEAFKAALPSDVQIRYAQGCKLSQHLGLPSTEQLGGQAIELTWHHIDEASEVVEEKPFHTSTIKETQLRNFLGGYQPDCDYFAIRAHFTLTAKTSGTHKISLETYGDMDLKIPDAKEADVQDWKYKGEVDIPTFMFNCSRLREVRSLTMEGGKPLSVSFEYRTARTPTGMLPLKKAGFRIGFAEYVDEEAILAEAASLAEEADVALVFTGTGAEYESEGIDRLDIVLPSRQNDLVRIVSQAAPGKTVVVNASGAAVGMPWAEDPAVGSILQAWFGGQESGGAVVDVLLGKKDAGGRMPHTWPKTIQDHPSYGNFPNSKGLDEKHGEHAVEYKEGLLYGHRWFEAKGVEPRWYFGQGQSYTTFEHEVQAVQGSIQGKADKEEVEVQVRVSNTGSRPGKHVLQLYHTGSDSTSKEPRRLVAFAEVKDLAPSSTKDVTLKLDRQSMARWIPAAEGKGQWKVTKGTHSFVVASSADPKDQTAKAIEVVVEQEVTWSA